MKVFYSPKCLEYSTLGHPETPQRVWNIFEALKDDTRFEFRSPQPAKEEDILLVHEAVLVEKVRTNTFLDADTPSVAGIFEYALLSAGGATDAAQACTRERYAFSCCRPPGHHATRSSVGGFCYFNNIAVAVARLLTHKKTVAILDIDIHHGNGTEDIFLGHKQVVYCSIHQAPLYPGTGLTSKKNCHNYPLPAGVNGAQYLATLAQALRVIAEDRPDILAVSVGFDTYTDDLLGGFQLHIEDYAQIGKRIAALNIPTFFVLEGGYSQDTGRCASSFFGGIEAQ